MSDASSMMLVPMGSEGHWAAAMHADMSAEVLWLRHKLAELHSELLRHQRRPGTLGILRLDYDYPPNKGDIDHPESFAYDVVYERVSGLTFEVCQRGELSPELEERLTRAIKKLEVAGAHAITGDCGFMMYLQAFARTVTRKPVFLSSLVQLPTIICAHAASGRVQLPLCAGGD